MSEIVAGALYAQIKQAKKITEKRRAVYEKYKKFLTAGCPELLQLPTLRNGAKIDGHMFFIFAPSFEAREKLRLALSERFQVRAFSHYVPLHLSAYGSKNCKVSPVSSSSSSVFKCEEMANRLLRLPMHATITNEEVQFVCKCVLDLCEEYLQTKESGKE
mmetsp:Transcript_10276/g.15454  ORF Transcript_10276/g.15454 Transcript_10276/m.15454 type:complete len:160 (-) Transcript_10276:89-568(-)